MKNNNLKFLEIFIDQTEFVRLWVAKTYKYCTSDTIDLYNV